MPKRLAIVVLLAIVLPVHGQKEGSQSSRDKSDGNSSQAPAAAPSGKATCVVKEDGTTIECRWPKDVPESKFNRLFSPENAPNIGLLIAGVGGILVAVCTLRKIERQTAATEKQADHMVTSERAWIIVSSRFPHGIEDGGQSTSPRVHWAMKNVGKSPARLIEFDAVASRAELGIPFPDPPRYVGPPRPLNRLLLVPNDSFGLTWMLEGDSLSPEEVQEVEIGVKLMIISYGYVKYLDVFGNERTTRFCQKYWFNRNTNEKVFLAYTEAPTSYTDCD